MLQYSHAPMSVVSVMDASYAMLTPSLANATEISTMKSLAIGGQ